jgi:hypothetical protein
MTLWQALGGALKVFIDKVVLHYERRLAQKEKEMANLKEAIAKIKEEVTQTRGVIASLRTEREGLLALVEEHKNDAAELQKVIDEFTKMNDEFDEAIAENPEDGEVVFDPSGNQPFEPSGNTPANPTGSSGKSGAKHGAGSSKSAGGAKK